MGLCPEKGRQERMMDIDDPLRIARDEIRRKNLHVASQNDQINFVVFDEFTLAPLASGLFSFVTGLRDRELRENRRGAGRPDDC